MKAVSNNKSGFTLLEAMVSLLITSLTLLLFTAGLKQASMMNRMIVKDSQETETNTNRIIGKRQLEWHTFLNQFELSLEDSEFIEIQSNKLVVKEWDEKKNKKIQVMYHQTQSETKNFRRSKTNGNNTMLTDIKMFSLNKKQQYLILNVTFKNGENYRGRICIDNWVD